jgi:hypothetical protein
MYDKVSINVVIFERVYLFLSKYSMSTLCSSYVRIAASWERAMPASSSPARR